MYASFVICMEGFYIGKSMGHTVSDKRNTQGKLDQTRFHLEWLLDDCPFPSGDSYFFSMYIGVCISVCLSICISIDKYIYIYTHACDKCVCVCVFFNGMMLIIYIYTVYI